MTVAPADAPSPVLARAAAQLLELERQFMAADCDAARDRLGSAVAGAALRLAREPGFGPADAALKLDALTRRLRTDLPPESRAAVVDYLLAESALAALAATSVCIGVHRGTVSLDPPAGSGQNS